jgi:periplasmic protein TonB
VAGAAPPLIPMRDGANRAFGYAILASILLHALLLLALPSLRELAAKLPPAPGPLVARLVQAQSKPEPAAPVEEPRKPPVAQKRPVAARPVTKPAVPPVAAPVAQPAAAVLSESAPPAPAAPAAPAAPGPVARIEPQPAATAPAGPDPGALDRYRLQLVTAAARFKRYPRSAIDNNWEGEVVVRMTIGADGRIAALGIKSSSGHEILDRQALEMFRIAKPFVLLPPELAGREFELELRAIYGLKDQGSG